MVKTIVLTLWISILMGCSSGGSNSETETATEDKWSQIKAHAAPAVVLTTEFNPPQRLSSVGTLSWEDGLYISDDGLTLFAFFAPVDIFKWVEYSLANPGCLPISHYIRGPILEGTDFDLETPIDNPWGCLEGIMHSDLAYATRDTISDPFSPWRRHPLSTDFVYDGGFTASANSDGSYDLIYSRSTESNKNDLYWLRNRSLTPTSATAQAMPAPINNANQQDNPHLERINDNDLVLLFDNHGIGDPDTQISFSLSSDDGSTWSTPQTLSINAANTTEDLGGHLYNDLLNDWWLYFTSNREGPVEIYRSRHLSGNLINDFDHWSTPEKVITLGEVSDGSGSIIGVGEPTLSANGDLYFAVVYCKNTEDQSATDSCDIDPWVAKRK